MIVIEVLNYNYKPLPNLKLSILERRAFEHFVAQKFVDRIKEKINKQNFDMKFQPLSSQYLRTKTIRREREGFWERTGALESLVVAKKAMFNPRVTFQHRKATYREIARALEYGTFAIPPRPLFREVLHEMRKNEELYYLMFKEGRK